MPQKTVAAAGRNWQTTIAGVCVLLATVGAYGAAMFDGDTSTIPSIPSLIAGITAGIGLIVASDGAKAAEK